MADQNNKISSEKQTGDQGVSRYGLGEVKFYSRDFVVLVAKHGC
jgi:hypothetical protein